MKTRRLLFSMFSLLLVIAMLAGCAPKAATTAAGGGGAKPSVPASVIDPLVKACKEEGMVTIIPTPASWANYGELFKLFEDVSGVKINSLDESAGSADELAAIDANKGNKGPQAPDIIDVGYVGKPVWVRYVLVEGLTDDPANVEGVAKFVSPMKNVEWVEVLPFHQLGAFKWKQLGLDYQLATTPPAPPDLIERVRGQFRDAGCNAR